MLYAHVRITSIKRELKGSVFTALLRSTTFVALDIIAMAASRYKAMPIPLN